MPVSRRRSAKMGRGTTVSALRLRGPSMAFVSAPLVKSGFHTKQTNSWCRRKHAVQRRCRYEMTLRPQDCSWKEDRDRRAIESEFSGSTTTSVDSDMSVLKERISVMLRKEKQWREICEQFSAISLLTGIPMVAEENGEPTFVAWTFLFLCISLPMYMLYLLSDWLHAASTSFSNLI